MTGPTFPEDDDPFQKPLLNDDIGTFPSPADPSVDQSYGSLSSQSPRSDRNGVAAVLIIGVGLVAVAAVVAAGYFVVKGIDAADESWVDEGHDLLTPAEYPPEITDLDALTAEPGEKIDSSDVEWTTQLVAGDDFSPGIYIARDAVPVSADETLSCYWTIENHEHGEPGRFSVYASIDDGSAIALIPYGYRFFPSPTCGVWEAVDPETLFGDATGAAMSDELYVVGYDVEPGLYLSEIQVVEESSCFVKVNKHYGFEGGSNYGEVFFGQGGSIGLDVEEGDFVQVRDCPTFRLADLETAYSEDAGATSIGLGTWIVGVDMRPGTYVGVPDTSAERDLCWAEVWEGKSDWDNAEPVGDATYYTDEDPATFTAELGQWVYAKSCGTWEMVEP